MNAISIDGVIFNSSVRRIRLRSMIPQDLRKWLQKLKPRVCYPLHLRGEGDWGGCCISSEWSNNDRRETHTILAVARRMDVPRSTVCKTVCKLLLLYPFKIKPVQELLRNDPAARESFALEFFAGMEIDKHWSLNILWAVSPMFT